jgi:hypothetical protein
LIERLLHGDLETLLAGLRHAIEGSDHLPDLTGLAFVFGSADRESALTVLLKGHENALAVVRRELDTEDSVRALLDAGLGASFQLFDTVTLVGGHVYDGNAGT